MANANYNSRIRFVVVLLSAVALTSNLVNACGIWGQVFCDYCWDGTYTSGKDSGLANVKVDANCTINKAGKAIYYWGSDTTDSNGYFQAPISYTSNLLSKNSAESSFLTALFVNGDYRKGQLSDATVVGCYFKLSKANSNGAECTNIAVNDGNFLNNGQIGNGWTTKVKIAQYQSTSLADIYVLGASGSLDGSVSATPPTRGQGSSSCPASPPPPPAVKGDPHFVGADGSRFDFTGEPGNVYCLVSDSHVHINALYGGRFDQWGDNPHKALTWIRKVGIMWGEHTVMLAAREGAAWQYGNGYMSRIEVDGKEARLAGPGQYASFANGGIEVGWLAAAMRSGDDLVDVYTVKIQGVMLLRLTLRPEVELLRTAEDGIVHFDLEVANLQVSDSVHGVLGQTFRSDHRNRLASQKLTYSELFHEKVVPGDNAEGFLDGVHKQYVSSSLFSADCKFSRFNVNVGDEEELALGTQLTTASVTSSFATSSRKLLKMAAA